MTEQKPDWEGDTKWCWAWYKGDGIGEWRLARWYGKRSGKCQVRFSGEKVKQLPFRWVCYNSLDKKPKWNPEKVKQSLHKT